MNALPGQSALHAIHGAGTGYCSIISAVGA